MKVSRLIAKCRGSQFLTHIDEMEADIGADTVVSLPAGLWDLISKHCHDLESHKQTRVCISSGR